MQQEQTNINDDWAETAQPPALDKGVVHVWLASLDLPATVFEECSSFLDPDEKERAARFRFEEHRRHYAAGRGLLRKLLAGYLQLDPGSFSFTYNQHGKPLLTHVCPDLSFNVSHSYGWALFGFALGTELGVDIEKERPDFATMEIAQRFFAPAEVNVLSSLPPPLRSRAFFKCWTRKEAFIKAHGQGLSMGLDKFVVAFAPDAPPALLHSALDAQAEKHWRIGDLPVPPGYCGALAIKNPSLVVRRMRPAFKPESL